MASPLDASRVSLTSRRDPKTMDPNSSYGSFFTDYMLTCEWTAEEGWAAPRIRPHGPLELDPASSVLHYGMCCFEGMKAYKDSAGAVRLFRPELNMARLNRSAKRLALPTFDEDALFLLIKQLVSLDQRFIPSTPGYSLYLRPTVIGTRTAIGLAAPDKALLFVILSPSPPYFSASATGGNPYSSVKLETSSDAIRAWPKGTGSYKIGGNYAPTVQATVAAARQGNQQCIWLYGEDDQVTEAGGMNLFVVIEQEDGHLELATPTLDSGLILPGITRRSILELARQHASGLAIPSLSLVAPSLTVSERNITMGELLLVSSQGRLREVFGCGTAVTVVSVGSIQHRDQRISLEESVADRGIGKVAETFLNQLSAIQKGEVEHEWSVVLRD